MKLVHKNHFLGDKFVLTLPISTIRDPCDRIAVGLGLGELHRRCAAVSLPPSFLPLILIQIMALHAS